MGQRGHRSMGEVISTFVFGVVGLWLAGEALLAEDALRQFLLGITALASLAGALRYPIASLVASLSGDDDQGPAA